MENNIFVGDTLFAPETGTARTDFPGGSASDLFDSIKKLYKYPKNAMFMSAIIIQKELVLKMQTKKCKENKRTIIN